MSRRLAVAAVLVSALAAALVLAPRTARAGSASANLAVSATVLGACTIADQNFAFGNYDPAANRDVAGSFQVSCTYNSQFWIGLGNGGNYSAPNRRMLGASGEFLNYQLYRDAYTTPWTNADPGTRDTANTVGPGFSNYTIPIWGRIPAGQNVSTGGYNDTVVMTINF